MSGFAVLNKSIEDLTTYLRERDADLKKTKYPDTYIIKFNPKTKIYDPTINQLRGLIFNPIKHQIYSLGYPVPVEFKDQDKEYQQDAIVELEKHKYVVYEAIDGTLLRLWYHPEIHEWVLSTNGVEDANDAFWMNNLSFAEQFYSAHPYLELTKLNTDYVYLFSLCHPYNIIVVPHRTPRIYHVATYDRTSLMEVDCDIGVLKQQQIVKTIQEIITISKFVDPPVLSAGYMVTMKNPETDGVVHRIRFENANYTKARCLRGESNNIYETVLGHMLSTNGTPEVNSLQEFLRYFPRYEPVFTELSLNLKRAIPKLYQEYEIRYIKHYKSPIFPNHYKFLVDLHEQVYLNVLQRQRRVIEEDVFRFLSQQETGRVLYIIGKGGLRPPFNP
jgi:hypothetical protein